MRVRAGGARADPCVWAMSELPSDAKEKEEKKKKKRKIALLDPVLSVLFVNLKTIK